MNEREYKTIVTPTKKVEVVLRSWLTGREKREIQREYLKDTTVNPADAAQTKISSESLYSAQDKMVQVVVEKVNGSTENILDTILDMVSEDYESVLAAVQEIVFGKDAETQKK